MGSSSGQSSSRGGSGGSSRGAAAPAPLLPPGWTEAEMAAGGRMQAQSAKGMPAGFQPGVAKTWVAAPARPSIDLQELARIMAQQQQPNPGTRNGIYYPGDRGSAWMEGGRGGTHASGGNAFGLGTAAGNAGRAIGEGARSIGRSLGIGDGKGYW